MKKHLTLSERAIIEKCIAQDMSFASIARKLERSPSTISREVLKHRVFVNKEPPDTHFPRVKFYAGVPNCSRHTKMCSFHFRLSD